MIIKNSITLLLTFLIFYVNAQEAFKNSSLSFDQRVEDLLSRLTLEEKIALMQDVSTPIKRLDIKEYNWWNEALHGVARAGLATVFPQPIGMAATFDENVVLNVFNAVSDEARAKHSYFLSQGQHGRYQGLTMWTPNINIFRDPRWGRGIETYGEDPYLTSIMGLSVVKGLQGATTNKYNKLHACAKHFAVHSGPEWNRHSFDAKNIKRRDLWETYLPAFETLVKEGGVKEVMCAYNRFEGEPCCGSNQLLMQILRNKWGFEGIVVADCGAISDFYKPSSHATHPNAATASAIAVKNGTDIDCGTSYKSLMESVKQGLISESELNVSVKRILKARFELGEMDDANNPWSNIPYSVVASKKHDSLSVDIARKSMTLLLNKNNILPLKSGSVTVAVMGPNANDSVMQWGNYNGTPAKTITILKGIQSQLGKNDKLIFEQGCGLVENTLMGSVFNQCTSEDGQGFSAKYWNNLNREGVPDAVTQITVPFNFSTTGATVFTPGVNLTDFAATYDGVFKPNQSGEVVFDFYVNGIIRLLIDGAEVINTKANHGSRKLDYTLNVEAGKSYHIQIEFTYYRGDAQLNFDLGFKKPINITQSVSKVKDADFVIFVGGISPSLEGEQMGVDLPGFKKGDRTNIELPEVQRNLIKALHDAGKKVILVNCSGSPIGLEPETKTCDAILQAWYPGQSGGIAVADVIFGKYNPAGRLPVTFYRNINQLPDFENYDMQGRTYRYLKDNPMFSFGYGLSYTSFKYGNPSVSTKRIKVGQSFKLNVSVTNQGKNDGDEVIQVYIRKLEDTLGPVKTLRAFKRVRFLAGETRNITFNITPKQMQWWHEESQSMIMQPGKFEIFVGSNSSEKDLKAIPINVK